MLLDQIMRDDAGALLMNEIAPTLYAFTNGAKTEKTLEHYVKGLDEYEKVWKILNLSSTRNQQQLEALITILTRTKILLEQVGETNSRLDALIHQMHNANIKLREKILQSNSQIEQAWGQINT